MTFIIMSHIIIMSTFYLNTTTRWKEIWTRLDHEGYNRRAISLYTPNVYKVSENVQNVISLLNKLYVVAHRIITPASATYALCTYDPGKNIAISFDTEKWEFSIGRDYAFNIYQHKILITDYGASVDSWVST